MLSNIFFLFYSICTNTDNSTLKNILPGVVDGTVELVLRSQGPEGGLGTGPGTGSETGTGSGTGTGSRMGLGIRNNF